MIHPKQAAGKPLIVYLGLRLGQIIDVDEKKEVISIELWVQQEWVDDQLKWNPSNFSGIQSLRVPAEHVWRPDILLYSNADGKYEMTALTRIEICYNGTVRWRPPALVVSSCRIDVQFFSYDEHICSMRFGSWTYDGSKVSDLPTLKSMVDSLNLPQDQAKHVVDLGLRERGLRFLSINSMTDVRALLRLVATAAIDGVCSSSTPFLLFADLVNTKPINEAEQNFKFLEDTIKALKDAALFGAGRNTLLRMCNDLLRRLSKSQNTVFCGRIQLFLTSLFPLNEKSGLNIMSNFNLDKEVAYNRDPDEDLFYSLTSSLAGTASEDEGKTGSLVNADIYRRFWSLQEVLKSPSQCYTSAGWKSFVECTECVVDTFNSIRLSSGSVVGVGECRWNRFTMYLTSEKLLDLQLMDPNFRQYILTQLLIITQYLTLRVKFKNENQRLDENQLRWVQAQREAIFTLLRTDLFAGCGSDTIASQPDPSLLVVDHILDREVHWNQWKNGGCPSFIKEPEKSTLSGRKRRINPLQDRSGMRLYRFGNHDLDELWSACPDNLAACRDRRRLFCPPNLPAHFLDAIMEMDPKEKVEEQYKSINREEWTWRALRLLSRRCNEFYGSWNPPGRSIKEYLTTILTEKLENTDPHRPGVTHSRQRLSGVCNRVSDTVSLSSRSSTTVTPAKLLTYMSSNTTIDHQDFPATQLFANPSREDRSRSPPSRCKKRAKEIITPELAVLDAIADDDGDNANSLLSYDDVDITGNNNKVSGVDDSDTDGEAADEDDDLEEEDEVESLAVVVTVPTTKYRRHRRGARD